MDEILKALGGILLRAVPTFLFVIVLYFFLKYAFFRPLERVLKARFEATEGARQRAAETLALAEQKTHEYEAAMREARAQIYQAQEQLHQRLEEQHKTEVTIARAAAEEDIRKARAEIAAGLAEAKQELEQQSEALAAEIADVVLARSVS
jgi:F-type H+-transporting ATPase subunit b